MSMKVIWFLVPLIPTTIPAQPYEKNGLPCISELCIGDGLPALGNIKWDRAKSDFSITGKPDYVGSHPSPASAITLIKNDFRGDLTKAAPYLSYRAFDAVSRTRPRYTRTATRRGSTIVTLKLWLVTVISRAESILSPRIPSNIR